ncbi:hypothetical protein [Natronoarchaeum rubrum]|uniref:hypothetical protein n=1 Tax=Natronoarchaeum rubrum TaxID=755311 RepID=UPI0021132A3F|nr:hypothetical protein [Natronoarchaeum rubrum]
MSEDAIERLIFKSIDESDGIEPDQGDDIYYGLTENKAEKTGIETIHVRVEDGGRITSANPMDGPNEYRWIENLEDWKRNYENS